MSGHRGRVAGVAVAPDGRVAASAAWDRTVRLVGSGDWGAGCGIDGACRQCECGGVYAGRWPGGQCGGGRDRSGLGAGGWAGGRGLWRWAAGQCAGADSRWQARGRGRDRRAGAGLGSWRRGLKSCRGWRGVIRCPVLGVAVSPDGKCGRLGGGEWGVVTLWALESGRVLHTLAGHRGPVWGLAFTPDGKRLLTAGGDGAIRIWDTATGAEIRTAWGAGGQRFGRAEGGARGGVVPAVRGLPYGDARWREQGGADALRAVRAQDRDRAGVSVFSGAEGRGYRLDGRDGQRVVPAGAGCGHAGDQDAGSDHRQRCGAGGTDPLAAKSNRAPLKMGRGA